MEFDFSTLDISSNIKADEVENIISFDALFNSEDKIALLFKSILTFNRQKQISCSILSSLDRDENDAKMLENISKTRLNSKNLLHVEFLKPYNSQKCRALKDNLILPKERIVDMIMSSISMDRETLLNKIINSESIEEELTKDIYVSTITRNRELEYRYSEKNIINSFKDNIIDYGEIKNELKEVLGDIFFTAVFWDHKGLQDFKEFIEERIPFEASKKGRKSRLTGEDIDMFHEREQDSSSKNKEAICDTHMDGA